MSKRLIAYVEGTTEELFVNRILRHHLYQHGIVVSRPILAATSTLPSGRRGGFVNWPAVEADLRTLFATETDPQVRFTSLLDVYALPSSAPGYPGRSVSGSRTTSEADAMEAAWASHFGEPRFTPYFQRHEFEALVLAHPSALQAVFPQHATALRVLENELAQYLDAEEVNEGPTTHPSARLNRVIPGYAALKASNALFVLLEAGLPRIRVRCPRFDAWLRRWEQWGAQS